MSDNDRQALNAIYRILTDPQRSTDTVLVAREIITTLRARGWRPTPAQRQQPWSRAAVQPSEPTPEYVEARAKYLPETDQPKQYRETRDAIDRWREAKP